MWMDELLGVEGDDAEAWLCSSPTSSGGGAARPMSRSTSARLPGTDNHASPAGAASRHTPSSSLASSQSARVAPASDGRVALSGRLACLHAASLSNSSITASQPATAPAPASEPRVVLSGRLASLHAAAMLNTASHRAEPKPRLAVPKNKAAGAPPTPAVKRAGPAQAAPQPARLWRPATSGKPAAAAAAAASRSTTLQLRSSSSAASTAASRSGAAADGRQPSVQLSPATKVSHWLQSGRSGLQACTIYTTFPYLS